MSTAIPARPTPEMVSAGAQELVAYFGIRETAARRWAANIYESMILVIVDDTAPAVPGTRYKWSDADVRGYLVEWAATLKATPTRLWPAKLKAVWPSTPPEFWGYGAAEVVTLPIPPSAAAIDRLDKVHEWICWLTAESRLLVSGRAQRVAWQKLAVRLGWSERTLRYRHADAIDAIVFRLQRTQPRIYPFDMV